MKDNVINDAVLQTENTETIQNAPLLCVKDLHKYFGSLEVLKGVNLDVRKGDVVAIIGPSGCGKSTFLRCLNLLESPNSGVIMLDGNYVFKNERGELKKQLKEMKARKNEADFDAQAFDALRQEYNALKKSEKAIEKQIAKQINLHRQRIGMVFQQFNLFPHLTVLKNITLAPMKLKKKSKEEAETLAMELLKKIGNECGDL